MPITQDRMIAIIYAARELKAVSDQIKGLVLLEIERAQRGAQTPENALQLIAGYVTAIVPNPDIVAPLTIEDFYFKRMAKRNQSETARQQRRRERKRAIAAGLTPAQSLAHIPYAPQSHNGLNDKYTNPGVELNMALEYKKFNDGGSAAEPTPTGLKVNIPQTTLEANGDKVTRTLKPNGEIIERVIRGQSAQSVEGQQHIESLPQSGAELPPSGESFL